MTAPGARSAASSGAVKVGVLSDTHGWLDPRVAAALAGADCIVHAGDVLDEAVLAELGTLADKVVAVRGNNDRDGALGALRETERLPLPGGELVVTHGDRFGGRPDHAGLRAAWPGARAVVYGHTHRLVCDRERLPWLLNPGAAGRERLDGGPSCLLLRAGAAGWSVEARRFPPRGG